MQCIHPPPLTDDELTAALDGEADRAIREHLDNCPSCAARLSEARQIEQRLRATLNRWDCPAATTLSDYHFGLLPPSEGQAISTHLTRCPMCAAELAELRAFLLADEAPHTQARPTGTGRKRLRELIAQVVTPAPAFALRGSARGPIIVEAGEITLLLELEPASEERVTLTGQLVVEDQGLWVGALVELRRDGAPLALATIDDIGAFHCESIVPGSASLRITPPHREVTLVLPDIELRANLPNT